MLVVHSVANTSLDTLVVVITRVARVATFVTPIFDRNVTSLRGLVRKL